ncbi:MAG: hypothetical protein SVQ76_02280 [Candidatus Nanohaloarchaea archaeon]|nr:hypothetical protein [Candidatus Nanohaloarchaea archaeon]
MKPDVTFLTSSELQKALGEKLSDEEEEELKRFRDQVLDFFGGYRGALGEMEELYGEEWYSFDVSVWVFEGKSPSISSPILLRKDEVETTVFDAFWMLARKLIRENPPDSSLAEPGYDGLDASSLALTVKALEESMEEEVHGQVVEAARSDTEDLKTWRKADEILEKWTGSGKELHPWMEGR